MPDEVRYLNGTPPENLHVLFRLEEINDGIEFVWFPIIKSTPCGAWVGVYGEKKFVRLNVAGKKYACHTIEEALESFKRRKQRQIVILTSRLKEAELNLTKATVLGKRLAGDGLCPMK